MAGLFDIFSNVNSQDAANAQTAGIYQGYNQATSALNQGNQALQTNYTAALQPFLQNYGQGQQGTQSLMAALGIGGAGGAQGAQAIQDQLANTPGYQFQLNQGSQNVLRNAAQTGTTASGATLNALQNQGQGQANQTYQQYVQNLQPFLGVSGNAAQGIGQTYTGLGQGLNQNANTLAQLGWTANTSAGNAQANADLANNQASANMWNAGMNVARLGASVLSDVFTKFDIHKVGKLDDDQNVYSFRYKADPGRTHIGLMAQEVEKTNPDAVTEVGGVKFVDYGKATDFSEAFAPFLKAA